MGARTRRPRRALRADGRAVRPAARRRRASGRPRLQAGAGARHVAERALPGRTVASGAGRTDRRAAGVGPRRARRGRRRGAPDAGDRPQDPQPAAGRSGFLRAGRRRADRRRTARAGQRVGSSPRRRSPGRALPQRPGRCAAGAGPWARFGSGWSTAPNTAIGPGCGMSLAAMRLPRYFRLLDALDALVADAAVDRSRSRRR